MRRQLDWLDSVRRRFRKIESEPLPANILTLLRAAAAEAPDVPAYHFIESGTEITYAALLADVERRAAGLAGLGVGRGSHVAVMLPNISEMPITWLALAALGAVMVPVNTRYTAHELRYLLDDSQATHLVIHHDHIGLLPDAPGLQVIKTGREWNDLLRTPARAAAAEPCLDDIVNIQYTSGTTGWPKGCLLTQRYWLTCAKAYSACDGLRFRRILAANPFFYMTPQWLSLMAFYQRATLYVAPYISLSRFTEWLQRHQIEFCWFPMDVMLQTPPAPSDRGLALRRGNLAIHRAERHAELERRYGFPARAAFGMTEIGCGLMMPLEASEFVGSGSCGMAGPFRTGDLAVQDEDGFFTIQGRIKEMIRRSGENISATEVEAALLAIPGIAEAAAVPVPDPLRGEEVKAYVVLAQGVDVAALPPERIVTLCSERLAAFKVPRLIEYYGAPLPRSTSGKVRKPDLLAEKADLRSGSWDRATGTWV